MLVGIQVFLSWAREPLKAADAPPGSGLAGVSPPGRPKAGAPEVARRAESNACGDTRVAFGVS